MKAELTLINTNLRRYTFESPKIKKWVEERTKGKCLNLFAGRTKLNLNEVRNDIDKSMKADYHKDALEFVKTWRGKKFDTIILDPPYAYRKAMEMYNGNYSSRFKQLAVEINQDIAGVYKSNFPQDEVIVTDAHQYLLDHFQEFDFIWSSPPCPTHSKLCFSQPVKRYADMTFYQEVLLLKSWFKGKWVVENVIPYYKYLIEPTFILGRHPFWSNFNVEKKEFKNIDVSRSTAEELSEYLGMPIPRIKARLLLRNCVEPKMGKHIFDSAYKEETQKLLSESPTSQTSPNGDFSKEKEHNISLKESSNKDSQISSNDETSLNNNIKSNLNGGSQRGYYEQTN